MKVKEAITLFQYYQRSSHKERTTASYLHLLKKFESLYGERPFDSIEPDEIYHFLETFTEGLAKTSRRLRYAQLKAFYNFIITRCSLAQLPQLMGYFDRNLLILHNPKKKVVTTNYVL